MANPLPLVALPGDDAIRAATVSMTNQNGEYPATNVLTTNPAEVAKSTTNSTTLTFGTPSVLPVAVALINTNATTATINGVTIPIASVDIDGQRFHAWLDLTGLIGAATSWAVVLTRPSGVVWIGRVVLVSAIYGLNLKYGMQQGRRRPGDVEIRTRLGSVIRHGAQIRTRWVQGVVDVIESTPLLSQLEATAQGFLEPFLFIPDENANDAWWVTFKSNDFSITIPDYDVREIPIAFEELSGGPPNG